MTVGLYENIGWLDVAVHQVGSMQEVQRAEYVVKYGQHMELIELCIGRVSEHFLEITRDIFHDYE